MPDDLSSTSQLPIISLAGLGQSQAADTEIARRLDDAFSHIGFCYFADTGIDAGLIAAMFDASRRFHAQPLAVKQAVAVNAYHRGYIALNSSALVSSTVADVKRPNYSDSFMVMHDVAPDDPAFGQPLQGPNQWPENLPGFRETALAYRAALTDLCRRLLRPMAIALSAPPDYFAPFFAHPMIFLRLLHYPPQPPDSPNDAYGLAPHCDYGFLTVLTQDDAGGLQVRRRDGTWLQATPVPGTFVVNVADMLSRWTGGHWPSTPHRVKNLSGRERFSIPFFFEPQMDTLIAPLPAHAPPESVPPVRYGDYLLDKLNKNYAYRK